MGVDWSSFLPDLISAVVTGLVVGGVLVWFERRLTLQRKRSDDMAWHGRLDRIGAVLSSPLPMTSASYRPYGDILDRLELMCDGIDRIHPKVAAELPELDFLYPIIRDLDALRRSADEAERTTLHMLSKSIPADKPSEGGWTILVPTMTETISSVREVVQTASPEEP